MQARKKVVCIGVMLELEISMRVVASLNPAETDVASADVRNLHNALSLYHLLRLGFRWGYDDLTMEKAKNRTRPARSSAGGRRILVVGRCQRVDRTILTELKVPCDRRKTGHREPIFQPPHGHPPVTLRWQDDYFVPNWRVTWRCQGWDRPVGVRLQWGRLSIIENGRRHHTATAWHLSRHLKATTRIPRALRNIQARYNSRPRSVLIREASTMELAPQIGRRTARSDFYDELENLYDELENHNSSESPGHRTTCLSKTSHRGRAQMWQGLYRLIFQPIVFSRMMTTRSLFNHRTVGGLQDLISMMLENRNSSAAPPGHWTTCPIQKISRRKCMH